jgi:hypothetical protein
VTAQFDAPPTSAASPRAAVAPATDAAPDPDRDQVVGWLAQLRLLRGVPFNYLVPEPRMLEPESIRFFRVDENWMSALVDGAFGVASAPANRAAAAHHAPSIADDARGSARLLRSVQFGSESTADGASAEHSGFLIRSSAIAGWPGMEIEAYEHADPDKPLDVVRLERLSPTVLLGIFAGTLARVVVRAPSEGVHFGLDHGDDEAGETWRKRLRYANEGQGHHVGDRSDTTVAVSLRGAAARRVVRMDALVTAMAPVVWAGPSPGPFTSAEFGLEMVETVEYVCFSVDPTGSDSGGAGSL